MRRRLFLSERHLHDVLARLPPGAKKGLRHALDQLREDGPDSSRLNIKALAAPPGVAPVFRMKVGTWRVAFRLRGRDIEVIHIFPRKDGYGWMERLE